MIHPIYGMKLGHSDAVHQLNSSLLAEANSDLVKVCYSHDRLITAGKEMVEAAASAVQMHGAYDWDKPWFEEKWKEKVMKFAMILAEANTMLWEPERKDGNS